MIEVFSDGSSTPGKKDQKLPGGYGWIVVKDGSVRFSSSGGNLTTTNNIMELMGAIEGLRAVLRSGIREAGERVVLVADSQYVLGIASYRMNPATNIELTREIRVLVRSLGMRYVGPEYRNPESDFRWVPGHRYKRSIPFRQQPHDVLLNERCDQLAHAAKLKFTPAQVLAKQAAKKARAKK